jgi:hypothetical protein
LLKKAELIMQEEQPSFEHVTVMEDPSFNENMTVKEETFMQMKEEPENEDEQPLMSSALEESASDDYDVERPDRLDEQTTGERIKLQGR